jgi:hypothetical protein
MASPGMQELGIPNDIAAVPLYFSEVNLGACIPQHLPHLPLQA